MPVPRTLLVAVLLGALVAPAVASPATAGAGPSQAGVSPAADRYGPRLLVGAGRPTAAGTGGAYAYDAALVPAGAEVALLSVSGRGGTRTVLAVRGLRPGHTYGTHLHRFACGADPAAAGDHYQRRPGSPTDPDHANPRNEVWLDVRANTQGAGFAVARHRWQYGRTWPRSVVLHAQPTSTDPDTPGVAGARVACVTLSAL